ncbi:hypothetical protein D3C73_1058410 [compost metagenome]
MQANGRGIAAFDGRDHHVFVAVACALDQHVHQPGPQAIAALVVAHIHRVLHGVAETVERPPVTE